MANQSKTTLADNSQIDWRTIRLAGGAATFMIAVSMVSVCAVGRSMDSAQRRNPPNSELSFLPSSESVPDPNSSLGSRNGTTEGTTPTQGSLASQRPGPGQYPETIHPAVVPAGESAPAAEAKGQPEPVCAASTVSLEFAKDPTEAAHLAKQEHKLMFVLHISGNLEESKFT